MVLVEIKVGEKYRLSY